jgi:microcystin-dependent protein
MAWFNWSQTASSNATADPTINWAEGQAPSSINDSARAMMAATAKYRDDIAGAILTSGTSTAYTVSSYSVFDTLAHLSGQMIAFTPHVTNGATVTLNVDSLGPKPLRASPNVELLAGTIIQGTPYVATYNNSDGAFYLQGFVGNPYNIPLAGGMPYFASTAPNSCFAFPYGQAISRTTYSTLFTLVSTTYGGGDGSTTFNVPDLRGKVTACLDNMGGAGAGNLAGVTFSIGNADTLGSVAGAPTQQIGQNQLPNVTPSLTLNAVSLQGPSIAQQTGITGTNGTLIGNELAANVAAANWSVQPTGSIGSINGGVTQQALQTLQPTVLCNFIMRII